jgi:hypothetical protein
MEPKTGVTATDCDRIRVVRNGFLDAGAPWHKITRVQSYCLSTPRSCAYGLPRCADRQVCVAQMGRARVPNL